MSLSVEEWLGTNLIWGKPSIPNIGCVHAFVIPPQVHRIIDVDIKSVLIFMTIDFYS